MKTLLIALIAFLSFNTTVLAQISQKPSKEENQKGVYTCPMHPHEMSMKEGKCPKCGTELMKNRGVFSYGCPMHPRQMSTKEGKCPKCGMDILKVKRKKEDSKLKGSAESKYICKMDGSTSDKPGKCPKCHMNMTKIENDKDKDKDKDEEHHKH
jgi:hypothetical protein